MEELLIQLNVEQETRIWEKYNLFEKKKGIMSFPKYVIAFCSGVIILIIGAGLYSPILGGTGILMMVFAIIVLNIHDMRFQVYADETLTRMAEDVRSMPRFYFSFDEHGMYVRETSFQTKFRWSEISYYNENDGDLYLFDKQKKIWRIISEEKIGTEAYQRFKGLLDREMSPKTNRKQATSD